MWLKQLDVVNIRNLSTLRLNLGRQFNVFMGLNGSGKTSLLEAIHLLSLGRSFRVSQIPPMIHFEAPVCTVSGVVSLDSNGERVETLGIEREREGGFRLKISGKSTHLLSDLSRYLPLQLINVDSSALFEEGSKPRRQFLDWIMFHVEPQYLQAWQRFNRVLLQRNQALKRQQWGEVAIWDAEYLARAEIIEGFRQQAVDLLLPFAQEEIRFFLGDGHVELLHSSGWSLPDREACLKQACFLDRKYGYSTQGPHRADLEVQWGGQSVRRFLSRGQMKLLVCALLLARARLVKERIQLNSIFLVDDLQSELDSISCARLLERLAAMGGQVLVTGIEKGLLFQELKDQNVEWFSVKAGHVFREVEALDA